MNYIVFDMEFNQDTSSSGFLINDKITYPQEIIQIGAVKLDSDLNTIAAFNRYIKPTIYSHITPFITELTGITTEQLKQEATFPEAYRAFLEFIGSPDDVLCSWGKVDIVELNRSVGYFDLDKSRLPVLYIDLQPYASIHLKQPRKKLLRLQFTVEALELPMTYPFHNAMQDAYYTAEILKKIMNPSIQPKRYIPTYIKLNIRPRQPKKTIDFLALYQQFEKMYNRPITEEEREMIRLSYQMGKTGQFVRQETDVKEQ